MWTQTARNDTLTSSKTFPSSFLKISKTKQCKSIREHDFIRSGNQQRASLWESVWHVIEWLKTSEVESFQDKSSEGIETPICHLLSFRKHQTVALATLCFWHYVLLHIMSPYLEPPQLHNPPCSCLMWGPYSIKKTSNYRTRTDNGYTSEFWKDLCCEMNYMMRQLTFKPVIPQWYSETFSKEFQPVTLVCRPWKLWNLRLSAGDSHDVVISMKGVQSVRLSVWWQLSLTKSLILPSVITVKSHLLIQPEQDFIINGGQSSLIFKALQDRQKHSLNTVQLKSSGFIKSI